MGLTFVQEFYRIPECYLLYRRRSDGYIGFLIGIVQVPDTEDEAIKLERKLSKNYRIERVFLDELASKGFHIVGDLNDD